MIKRKTIGTLMIILSLIMGTIYSPSKSSAMIDVILTQTKATKNSVTFKWEYKELPVDIYINSKLIKSNYKKQSYTYKNKSLTPGQSLSVVVKPHGQDEGQLYSLRTIAPYIGILPMTYSSVKDDISVNWTPNSGACDGYQVYIYNKKGKKIKSVFVEDGKSGSVDGLSIKKNQFISAKVRGYITLKNKKYYGVWSKKRYGVFMSPIKVEKLSGHKIRAKWTKTKGASKYEVLVGTKADGQDAVKVATVSSKKNTYTVSKVSGLPLESGKYYHVFVRPFMIIKKKQKGSDIFIASEAVIFYAHE